MHHRFVPREHRFSYEVFLAWLDLDELDELDDRLRFFSHNRGNLYAFHDRDHFGEPARSLKENAAAFLTSHGVLETPARIRVLTLPRTFGHVFNPVSFHFCDRADGTPLAAIAEVQNTFREIKPYLVDAPLPGASGFERRVTKHFYVSPFFALDDEFHFRLPAPGERLAMQVDDYTGDQRTLHTTLTGRRVPLTDGQLLRQTLRCPLVTMKVISAIHWEAFRLWRKGIPYHAKSANPHLQRDLERPHIS
jgi:DUF1365 family protein